MLIMHDKSTKIFSLLSHQREFGIKAKFDRLKDSSFLSRLSISQALLEIFHLVQPSWATQVFGNRVGIRMFPITES